jgi:hypothetical protein
VDKLERVFERKAREFAGGIVGCPQGSALDRSAEADVSVGLGPSRTYVPTPARDDISGVGWRIQVSFVLAFFVALLTLILIAPLALYGTLARCDEGCDSGPGSTHSRDAWQWNAMSALSLVAVVLAVALRVLVAKTRALAARLAAVGYAVSVLAWVGLWATDTDESADVSASGFFYFAGLVAIGTAAVVSAWLAD